MGYNNLSELFTATADAIRAKTGGTDPIVANDFPAAIEGISGGGDNFPIGDGNMHIWITLHEGRTSPVLGVGVNGTVTVDWGDGTSPDTLTGSGTSTAVWTPVHNYAAPGDYVITLTIDGEVGIVGKVGTNNGSCLLNKSTSGNGVNPYYRNAIKKVELCDKVTAFSDYAMYACYSVESIAIPKNSVTSIRENVFYNCYALRSIVIPEGVTIIGENSFRACNSLASVEILDGVTSIENSAFYYCYGLASATLPDSVESIGDNAFGGCYSLPSIVIPEGVTSIGSGAFSGCSSLAKVRFNGAVPPSAGSGAFSSIPADCIISVPAGSLEAYTTAENYPSAETYTYVEE